MIVVKARMTDLAKSKGVLIAEHFLAFASPVTWENRLDYARLGMATVYAGGATWDRHCPDSL